MNLKAIIAGIIAFIVVLTVFLSFNIVEPTERAVIVRLGTVSDEVHQSGLMFKIPYIETVKKFDIAPKQTEITFEVDENGALSKDMQTIGVTVSIFYKYDENRILEIVKDYNTAAINDLFKSTLKGVIKDEIGKFTIYNIIEKQDTISLNVKQKLSQRLIEHPIKLVELNMTNWDWSDNFDKQIEQTMTVAQEAKREAQNLEKQKSINSRDSITAANKKEIAIIEATGKFEAAKRQAQADSVLAQSASYKNEMLNKNLSVEIRLKELEIEKIKAEKWDGHYVPVNNYGPIPVSTNGRLLGI